MKRVQSIYLCLLLCALLAVSQASDTGTIRLSWSEFQNQKTERAGISVGKAFFNTKTDDEWNKYEVRFEITNKGTSRIKVRYLISIFDKSQNLIYAAAEEKGIEGGDTKEVKTKEKISSAVKFDPETVYIRVWSEKND